MLPGREIRSWDSTTSGSDTRFAGSKRRRAESEDVIPSVEEYDTLPPLGSAENPVSISSDNDDSEINGGASPPKRRRIHSDGVVPPEYSPITPLRDTFWSSVSDSRRQVRGPTSESAVEDDDRYQQLQVDSNRDGDHDENSGEDTVRVKSEVEYWDREEVDQNSNRF